MTGGEMTEKFKAPVDDKRVAETSGDTAPDAARREVLKRLGVYGAFAAPAILTVLSSKASAQILVESAPTTDPRKVRPQGSESDKFEP